MISFDEKLNNLKKKTMDLKQLYREETNLEPYQCIEIENNFTRHYVKWLEAKLTLTDVSQQRELLLAYEKSQYETTWWMSEAEATNRINDFLANNCG